MLLDRPYNKFPTEKVLHRIREETLALLLDRQVVKGDGGTLEAVALDENCLELLFVRNPNISITQKALQIVVRNDEAPLRLLLNKWENTVVISEDIMTAAIEGSNAIRVLRLLLYRLGTNAPISESLLVSAAKLGNKNALRLLVSQRRPLHLQAIWEAIWQVECCLKRDAPNVLCEYANLHLSESMLEKMISNSNADVGNDIKCTNGILRQDDKCFLFEYLDDYHLMG